MGAAEGGRELGDAGRPLVVGAIGLVSLTAGLAALAASLAICGALVALARDPQRNMARGLLGPGEISSVSEAVSTRQGAYLELASSRSGGWRRHTR
jgi:hypothetical protein